MPSGGAGSSPAGVGPAGYDPVGAPPTQIAIAPSNAVRFDPNSRDFAGTSGGYWDTVHWVDQVVTLNLTIQRGKLRSAPEVGVRYREIVRLGDNVQAEVEDMTQEALSTLLAAPPKIRIVSIVTEQPVRGQLLIEVNYLNLLTQRLRATRTSNR